MKFSRFAPSLIAIAVAAPLAATPGSVRDFQLRPAPTPTPTPQIQGPVDVEGAVPRAPRPIATATPRPAETAPSASRTPSSAPPAARTAPAAGTGPTPSPRQNSPTNGSQTRQPSARAPSTRPPASQVQQDASPQSGLATGEQELSESTAPPTLSELPTTAPTAPAATSGNAVGPLSSDGESGLSWPAILGGLAALAALLAGGLWFWRKNGGQKNAVPQIELPLVQMAPEEGEALEEANQSEASDGQAGIAAPTVKKSKFQVKVQAASLSRSLMNATFIYHLELQNLGLTPIGNVEVHTDLATAHGKAPVSEQLADSQTILPVTARVADIPARGNHAIRGEIRLPLDQIRTLNQGNAKLFVPLLRLKVISDDIDPLIHTFVVGIRPQATKGKLLPFRLDEMAQTYREIGLRQIG